MIEPLEAEERGRLNLEASRLIGWEYIIREGDFTLKDGSNHRCMLRLVARDGSISTSGAPGSGDWEATLTSAGWALTGSLSAER
jgi:hypothetical protein